FHSALEDQCPAGSGLVLVAGPSEPRLFRHGLRRSPAIRLLSTASLGRNAAKCCDRQPGEREYLIFPMSLRLPERKPEFTGTPRRNNDPRGSHKNTFLSLRLSDEKHEMRTRWENVRMFYVKPRPVMRRAVDSRGDPRMGYTPTGI